MTGSGFDAATALVPTGAAFASRLDPAWSIGGKPNGGYLLAVLARAAAERAPGHPDPIAVSAHFLRAPALDPEHDTIADVDVLRRGRTATQLRATLRQDGVTCVEALLTFGALAHSAEPWWAGVTVPDLPPAEDCRQLPSSGPPGSGFTVPLLDVLRIRLDPACAGFASGRPSGVAEFRGYVEHADGRPFDPLSLLVAVDCLPPVTFELGSLGWAPTLELTAYLRARPAEGPLVVRQRGRLVDDGRLDEVCEVWDATGRLVAQATQLASVRLPERPAVVSSR